MPNKTDSILIFTASEFEATSPDVRRGLRDTVKGTAVRAHDVAVSTLQHNMSHFLVSLGDIVNVCPKDVGGLALDEIEIRAQIDGKGNVGILSLAGAELAAQGCIRFVLRKKL